MQDLGVAVGAVLAAPSHHAQLFGGWQHVEDVNHGAQCLDGLGHMHAVQVHSPGVDQVLVLELVVDVRRLLMLTLDGLIQLARLLRQLVRHGLVACVVLRPGLLPQPQPLSLQETCLTPCCLVHHLALPVCGLSPGGHHQLRGQTLQAAVSAMQQRTHPARGACRAAAAAAGSHLLDARLCQLELGQPHIPTAAAQHVHQEVWRGVRVASPQQVELQPALVLLHPALLLCHLLRQPLGAFHQRQRTAGAQHCICATAICPSRCTLRRACVVANQVLQPLLLLSRQLLLACPLPLLL
mmetsp:Transcript_8392/g.17958  ORF Transcript_8392/g.17958 Transcript_8392/m.17958 type:complete len:296 (-) Transcript_8392:813-1700(-)